MKNGLKVILVLGCLLPAVAHADQGDDTSKQSSTQGVKSPQNSTGQAQSQTSRQAAPGQTVGSSSRDATGTIDCPPAALAKVQESLPSSSPVGTPGGTGSGSGAEAVSGKGEVHRVEGTIENIDSSRTARAIEVGGVKLWVEPTTAVLVDCQKASVADLKQGTPVKAMYEDKAGRSIAKVVEAKKQ
jgi:hypothetical protein